MTGQAFDLVTVGGGIGGAALARATAEQGARVLVLERERRFTDRGHGEEVRARLVVGADGRGSQMRKWAGFTVRRDPERLLFSGVLLDGVPVADDAAYIMFNPAVGRISLLFPQGSGRVRAYVGYHKDADPPRGQQHDLARFVDESVRAGVERALYAAARPAGPLALFEGADAWVDHPYRDGVALVGDAAATSDPTWGQGISLTLRD